MDMAKQSTAQVTVVHLTSADRVLSGLKILGICWLAATFAVLIPIAHFILVPAGLLAGIFLFYRNYKFSVKAIEGSIPCPKCEKSLPTSAQPFEWPKHETCPACGIDILLKKS
jgi:hypothetical protein